MKVLFAIIAVSLLTGLAVAQELKPVDLPKPDTTGGTPLMQALQHRQSAREFGADTLPTRVLANLCWAAAGINRPNGAKRTAPSARNWQEVDLYVATAHGLFRYDAAANRLVPVVAEDVRAKTGTQDFVKEVPVNLIYVADHAKMTGASKEDYDFYAGADAAFMAENAYLYCASEGLAVVVRASVDRESLAAAMKLSPTQRIVFAQSVGYPKK